MNKRILGGIFAVILILAMTFSLVACASIGNFEIANKNLTKHGYEVSDMPLSEAVKDALTKAGINNDGHLYATLKDNQYMSVTLIKFDSSDIAKKASETIKDTIYGEYTERLNRAKDKAKDDATKKSIDDIIAGSQYIVSDMWIVFGHKDSIKALY